MLPRYRATGRWQLHHLLAAPAGFLEPGDLDDLHLRRDHVEDFARVLADKTQFTAAFRATVARIEFPALANGLLRYARPTAHDRCGRACQGGDRHRLIGLIDRRRIALRRGDQEILQRQFQLFDLALDLFRGLAEDLFLQLGDA
ncbi:hypothetical protein GCM10011491_35070 [Brucella endophytica]|uniref:Uncharacterized protein n=1 Tax=Brucella endophytica TaxID=1963359 RepID=A0A916SK15_9HYPH|nr:hypothetical protein GCM10011491_35070 [Brucella endophytica]